MRSIKNITLGLATVGVMSLSGCAGDYLDTIPSTSVSETTINTSLDNLYIALNGIHKEMVSQESGYQCLGGEPGFKVNDVNHYSEMVAWGLKARVALAMQDYNNAAVYAGKSISLAEAGGHRLMTGSQLNCGFANITTDTKEAMYAAMTPDDKTVYFYSYYAYMSWNFNSSAIRQGVKCINVDAYETMSETDLRRAWWDPTGEASVPSSSYAKNAYQNRKFTARSTADAVGDVAFMRLAEMYLTQAEALARAGKDSEAQTVFTKFQITRDPSYVSKGNIGDALAEEIMNSRRVELWGEGFRFYDLKRLHMSIKCGSNFDIAFCTFLEKDKDAQGWVWEIPKIETDFNSLCTKNY